MFAWNLFILTKQTITSCAVTEKFRKVNFPSHDRVCDDRIRHLNHLRSLIALSTKVNNLQFWKFEFSQERRCHGSVKIQGWWFVFDKQVGRLTDPVMAGRVWRHNVKTDMLRLIHLRNRMITAHDTARRTPDLSKRPNFRSDCSQKNTWIQTPG